MSPASFVHRLLSVGMVRSLVGFDPANPERGLLIASHFVDDLRATGLRVLADGARDGRQKEIDRGHAHLWVADQADAELARLTVEHEATVPQHVTAVNAELRAAMERHPSNRGRLVRRVPSVRLPRQRVEVS